MTAHLDHLIRTFARLGSKCDALISKGDYENPQLGRLTYDLTALGEKIHELSYRIPGDPKEREKGNGETRVRFKVYPANVSEETIAYDFDLEGSNMGCEGRPGRWFHEPVRIKRGKYRTLVTKTWALDI